MKKITGVLLAFIFWVESVTSWALTPLLPNHAPFLSGVKGLEVVNGDLIFAWDEQDLAGDKEAFLRAFFTALQLRDEHLWVDLGLLKSVDEVLDPALKDTVIGKAFIKADIELKKAAMEMMKDAMIDVDGLGKFRLWIEPDVVEIAERVDGKGLEIRNIRLKVRAEIGEGIRDEMRRYIEGEMVKGLTKEVNEGKAFEELRKVFRAIALARWYKERAKEGWPYYEVAGKDVMNDSLREEWDIREYLAEYGRVVFGTLEESDVPYVGGGVVGSKGSIRVVGKVPKVKGLRWHLLSYSRLRKLRKVIKGIVTFSILSHLLLPVLSWAVPEPLPGPHSFFEKVDSMSTSPPEIDTIRSFLVVVFTTLSILVGLTYRVVQAKKNQKYRTLTRLTRALQYAIKEGAPMSWAEIQDMERFADLLSSSKDPIDKKVVYLATLLKVYESLPSEGKTRTLRMLGYRFLRDVDRLTKEDPLRGNVLLRVSLSALAVVVTLTNFYWISSYHHLFAFLGIVSGLAFGWSLYDLLLREERIRSLKKVKEVMENAIVSTEGSWEKNLSDLYLTARNKYRWDRYKQVRYSVRLILDLLRNEPALSDRILLSLGSAVMSQIEKVVLDDSKRKGSPDSIRDRFRFLGTVFSLAVVLILFPSSSFAGVGDVVAGNIDVLFVAAVVGGFSYLAWKAIKIVMKDGDLWLSGIDLAFLRVLLANSGLIDQEDFRKVWDTIAKAHPGDALVQDAAWAYWFSNRPQLLEVLRRVDDDFDRKMKSIKVLAEWYEKEFVKKGKGIDLDALDKIANIKPGGIDLREVVLTPVNYGMVSVGM